MNCNVENLGIKNYELTCKPKSSFKANLNGAEGRLGNSNKNIVLNFKTQKYGNIDFAPETYNYYQKKSSNGLNGGAIAGIIIACVAALIATGVAVALCRGSSKPPIQEYNIGDFNSQSNLK